MPDTYEIFHQFEDKDLRRLEKSQIDFFLSK